MKRRIFTNLALAFIALPGIKILFDYIKLERYGSKMFGGTFLEYEKAYAPYLFFGIAPLFLLFILLPYNYFILKGHIAVLKKILLCEVIVMINICLVGSFFNIWSYPYWENISYIIKTIS
ncbi:hypothetical protein [Pedobacter sp. BMA]|uniref:hypothetical protein n=1 Tax=Pedobacter sp. BMA TaxID=1663685 RepID=UPI0006495482|nr:hypothetical protein [Pedobacter sp. BMA]KLT63881.1 hypothetical protein AB669_19305 [Pedobacter sp. BMA]